MKKIAVVLFVLTTAFAVYADNVKQPENNMAPQPEMQQMMPGQQGQQGQPGQQPGACQPMPGPGHQMGAHMGKPMPAVTQDQAKAEFKTFMDKYMKGYEIKDINSVYMPFGALHQATVTDKTGNTFYLNLGPEKEVRGPIVPMNK